MATIFKKKGRKAYIIQWMDHTGKRREKSSRTTDKRTAERIAAKLESDAALRREGVIDARMDQIGSANRKPLREHVEEYLAHCQHIGQADKNIVEKTRHLNRFMDETGADRFIDLTADLLEQNMRTMKGAGYSNRSANFRRQTLNAFVNWCVARGRLDRNPFAAVGKLDEQRDRRHIRRPLTDEEVSRLLAVAKPRGRRAWYMAALLAGLRKSDMTKLQWRDIDFKNQTVTIREGKAKRVDVIPLHPQLAKELHERQESLGAGQMDRVFPSVVTDRTRQKDFLRAGLAREVPVLDDLGEPVRIGKGSRQRVKTEIVTEDEQGRVIDLHAMRTTLGTNLAKLGVAPQLAQQILRHADYRTTQKHYMLLEAADTSWAIRKIWVDTTEQSNNDR